MSQFKFDLPQDTPVKITCTGEISRINLIMILQRIGMQFDESFGLVRAKTIVDHNFNSIGYSGDIPTKLAGIFLADAVQHFVNERDRRKLIGDAEFLKEK